MQNTSYNPNCYSFTHHSIKLDSTVINISFSYRTVRHTVCRSVTLTWIVFRNLRHSPRKSTEKIYVDLAQGFYWGYI